MIANWDDSGIMKKLRQRYLDKLELVGEFGEDIAKTLCPVDLGHLRSSIHHEVNKDEMSVTIGTPTEYAAYVEFGTGEKAEGGNGRQGGWFYTTDHKQGKGHLLGQTKDGKYLYFTYGSKPQPFLRPILTDYKKQIEQIINL